MNGGEAIPYKFTPSVYCCILTYINKATCLSTAQVQIIIIPKSREKCDSLSEGDFFPQASYNTSVF
jgi:hypothetical protein